MHDYGKIDLIYVINDKYFLHSFNLQMGQITENISPKLTNNQRKILITAIEEQLSALNKFSFLSFLYGYNLMDKSYIPGDSIEYGTLAHPVYERAIAVDTASSKRILADFLLCTFTMTKYI